MVEMPLTFRCSSRLGAVITIFIGNEKNSLWE